MNDEKTQAAQDAALIEKLRVAVRRSTEANDAEGEVWRGPMDYLMDDDEPVLYAALRTIDRQTAEIARLRGLLARVPKLLDNAADDVDGYQFGMSYHDHAAAIRAALDESDGK